MYTGTQTFTAMENNITVKGIPEFETGNHVNDLLWYGHPHRGARSLIALDLYKAAHPVGKAVNYG